MRLALRLFRVQQNLGKLMSRSVLVLLSLVLMPFISPAAMPDACTLLTAKDAAALAGQPLTATPSSDPTMCRYHAAGGPGALGVEIHVKVVADAAAAHAQFPKWVVPFPGSAGPTVTEVKNLGDEAAIVRNSIMSGVNFRRGAVLVKIGQSLASSWILLTSSCDSKPTYGID
jgi:hypothetical protein